MVFLRPGGVMGELKQTQGQVGDLLRSYSAFFLRVLEHLSPAAVLKLLLQGRLEAGHSGREQVSLEADVH